MSAGQELTPSAAALRDIEQGIDCICSPVSKNTSRFPECCFSPEWGVDIKDGENLRADAMTHFCIFTRVSLATQWTYEGQLGNGIIPEQRLFLDLHALITKLSPWDVMR